MWDVKQSIYKWISPWWIKFYLNYVGCKVLCFRDLYSVLQGFTLTMWDVKDDERTTEICKDRFYLNYVGCKARNSLLSYEVDWQSFTLTMWDVKVNAVSVLTPPATAFYLNYVGCKGLWTFDTIPTLCRFTLTMWDVKIELGYISRLTLPRFTLTMWDVKTKSTVIFAILSTVLP